MVFLYSDEVSNKFFKGIYNYKYSFKYISLLKKASTSSKVNSNLNCIGN